MINRWPTVSGDKSRVGSKNTASRSVSGGSLRSELAGVVHTEIRQNLSSNAFKSEIVKLIPADKMFKANFDRRSRMEARVAH
jgi:hypothetical protein